MHPRRPNYFLQPTSSFAFLLPFSSSPAASVRGCRQCNAQRCIHPHHQPSSNERLNGSKVNEGIHSSRPPPATLLVLVHRNGEPHRRSASRLGGKLSSDLCISSCRLLEESPLWLWSCFCFSPLDSASQSTHLSIQHSMNDSSGRLNLPSSIKSHLWRG